MAQGELPAHVRQLFLPSRTVRLLVYYMLVGVGLMPILQGFGILDYLIGPLPKVLIGLSALLSMPVARWLHRRQQDRTQSERNSRASELGELLSALRDDQRAEPVPPYVLYLRSFATVGHLPFPLAKEDRTLSDNYLYGSTFDLESWLGKVAREGLPSWNVYAIGDLGGGVGADKIHASDEEWQRLFALLAARAQALVVCPMDRPGTRWEIDAIIASSDLLRKTVFAMPPPRRFGGGDVEALWEKTRTRLRDKVPAFPAFRSGCTLFALRPGDLAVLELHRGPVSLKRFKALVLGLCASSEIEALWREVPADIQAELRQLLGELANDPQVALLTHTPVVTPPVELGLVKYRELGLTPHADTRAFQWLVERGLVLFDESELWRGGPGTFVARLHPALLAWTQAQHLSDGRATSIDSRRREWNGERYRAT
jgi:hypothetical protein